MSTAHSERCQRLISTMAEEDCDAVAVFGNAWQADYLRFVTDFTPLEGDGLALFLKNGEIDLFVENPADAERASMECLDIRAHFSPDIVAAFTDHVVKTGACRRLGAAPATLFPQALAHSVANMEVGDATGIIDPLLLVKSPAEIDAMRQVCKLADDGYRAFMEASRVGRTEYELAAEVEAYLRSQGCAENFMILGSGGVEVMGMHPPGERKLQAGDLVTTEITPCFAGYNAQVCRTLVLGEPTEAQLDAFAVYIEAAEAGEAVLKGGVTAAEVAKAENDVFRKHGLGEYTTNKYTRVRGHGMGLFVDSKPHILEDVDTVIPAGSTIIVHPNTYHPTVGYMVFGDLSLVTEDGCENMGTLPRELFSMPAGG
ncbi:MAG: Xaa-Pro peptidase family protein [Rhodospirillales bacterium]|jgi:Xaa-Pro aminopeptidase|nr:Xaa-Pro peptidase family protein [Rhodospirillales bacterium]